MKAGLRQAACFAVGVLLCGALSGAAPQPAKTVGTPQALVDAGKALLAEFEASKGTPPGRLRTECDYFKDAPPAEVTFDQLLQAIGRSVSNDPVADAYVRWQMLSAIHDPPTDQQAAKLLAIYRTAPKPSPRFGSSQDDRRRLDRAIQQPNLSEATVNAEFKAEVDRRRLAQQPIVEFRNELFGRIPMSADLLVAGLEDAYVRMPMGSWEWSNTIIDGIVERTAVWAIVVNDPRILRSMASKVEAARNAPRATFYQDVELRSGVMAWREGGSDLKSDRLTKLQAELLELANSASNRK